MVERYKLAQDSEVRLEYARSLAAYAKLTSGKSARDLREPLTDLFAKDPDESIRGLSGYLRSDQDLP